MEQEKKTFKLNYKNTFKIAFAFFGILMLWSVYNTYCPIILEAMLGENHDYLVGIIMALDNVAALLIMPVFGKLSDNTKSKFGKRMPYIVIGMALTAICFPFIAFACKWNSIAGVIIAMMLFLIIMQAYRNPAVALMPDITPKPIRSKANGIINLVGYIGGVFATVLGMLPFFKMSSGSSLDDIQTKVLLPFLICTAVFIAVLIFLIITVKENKLLEETKADVEAGEKLAETEQKIGEDNKLSKQDKRNFLIILAAVFLWFMSFNAFETFGSLYFKNVVGDSTLYALMSTVLSVVSILSFILFSGVSNKIGRKWTILTGIFSMAVSLVAIAVISIVIEPAEIQQVSIGTHYNIQKEGYYLACIREDGNAELFTTTEIRKDKATGIQTPIVIMLNGKVVEGIDVKEEGSEYQYEIWFNTGKEYKNANKEGKELKLTIMNGEKESAIFYEHYIGRFLDNEGSEIYLKGQEKVKLIWKLFFVLVSAVMGFGWALININSFPMVVEYSNSKNLGKFTGYYYMASMLAQSITPIIIGIIMDKSSLGQRLLFVYSGILMVGALVVFFLVKEKYSVKQRLEMYGSQGGSALENLGSMDD